MRKKEGGLARRHHVRAVIVLGTRGQRFGGKDPARGQGCSSATRSRWYRAAAYTLFAEAPRTNRSLNESSARFSRGGEIKTAGFLPTKRRGEINQEFFRRPLQGELNEGSEDPSTLSPTAISTSASLFHACLARAPPCEMTREISFLFFFLFFPFSSPLNFPLRNAINDISHVRGVLSKEVIYRHSLQLHRVEATFEIVISGEWRRSGKGRERGRKRERQELKRSRFDAVDNAQLATRN